MAEVIKGSLIVDGVLIARDIVIKRGAHGDILYKHRQKWKKLHIGTQGQVLIVDADGFPSWGNLSGAFNDYDMETFGGLDFIGAHGAMEPQPDVAAGLTVSLMHDGYYYYNPS